MYTSSKGLRPLTMKNVLLLKSYESSLHINPSFQFLSSIRPKSRSLYTLLPTYSYSIQYTYGGGGQIANSLRVFQARRIQLSPRIKQAKYVLALDTAFYPLSLHHLK